MCSVQFQEKSVIVSKCANMTCLISKSANEIMCPQVIVNVFKRFMSATSIELIHCQFSLKNNLLFKMLMETLE